MNLDLSILVPFELFFLLTCLKLLKMSYSTNFVTLGCFSKVSMVAVV